MKSIPKFKYLVLGAGPAGLAVKDLLGDNSAIFDKNSYIGGLCSSFMVGDFRFDYSAHFSFTPIPEVIDHLSNIPDIKHAPEASNYVHGYWVKHPVQNNLFPLPEEEKKRIIQSFENVPSLKPNNYAEWLTASYGTYFSEEYPYKYTRKYWCHNPEDLSTTWCGKRMHVPSLEEVRYGATHESTPNVYYAKTMNYPQKGGFSSFFARTNNSKHIFLNKLVTSIDAEKKIVSFSDGTIVGYDVLFSSLPLPEMAKILLNTPNQIKEAAAQLQATSMVDVSIGFRHEVKIPALWFYIYDEDIPFSRVYSPSLASPDNAPKGKSSLQFEYYYVDSRNRLPDDVLLEKAKLFLSKNKMAKEEDIEVADVRTSSYANVVFLNRMEQYRTIVLDYVKAQGIIPIGRFGEWDYLWSDQSYFSGYKAAEKFLKE